MRAASRPPTSTPRLRGRPAEIQRPLAACAPHLLYGCVPVFFCSSEAKPFDEVIAWEEFSLIIQQHRLVVLPTLLADVSDARIVAMRTAMGRAVRRLLWDPSLLSAAPLAEKKLLKEDPRRPRGGTSNAPGDSAPQRLLSEEQGTRVP